PRAPHRPQLLDRNEPDGGQEPRGPPRPRPPWAAGLAANPNGLRPLHPRWPGAGGRRRGRSARTRHLPRDFGMRIIAGEWRGRRVEAPSGSNTRPTGDRVRETLFSMLASRIGSFEDLRVADLFAGSGALGFEALSRGAASATFVESDPVAAAAIRRNADQLG